ncbi:ABC transporter substrate-binding protein [Labilibaculum sp.]|uniref:ABC transporter substrate-binding protein n=1 Tax=Labilibaculum sp. TaxID=2060723 RepID=UPI00356976B4
MKHLFLFLLIFTSTLCQAKTITDMAGRKVSIPETIERILPYDAKTSILLFPVASEKMIARAFLPGSKHHHFIADAYNQLPQVDLKNIESVLISNPQIIIAGAYIGSDSYDRFEKMQHRTHIPILIIDLNINKLDSSYLFLGKLLDTKGKCKQCSAFLQNTYRNTQTLIKENPLSNTSVYYTLGNSGLLTDPSGSKHSEVLDYLQLNNAAKVAIPTGGHANVNLEQVLEWNPDYIFAAGFKNDNNAFAQITTSKNWESISAVKNAHVYKVPTQPFGWFDHPPSINRIPAIIWLSNLFYKMPAKKVQEQVQLFYQLFYGYELSENEYLSLIQ